MSKHPLLKIMPAGTKAAAFRVNVHEWVKKGGFAGINSVRKTLKKAKALGFLERSSVSGGTPDGNVVNHTQTYISPEGHKLETHTHYGVTSQDNRYSLTLTLVNV